MVTISQYAAAHRISRSSRDLLGRLKLEPPLTSPSEHQADVIRYKIVDPALQFPALRQVISRRHELII